MIILTGFIMLLIIPFNSSAKKHKFKQSTVVPAAEGYVKVKTDNNQNYLIKVEIVNLAGIERMESSKTTYVVWMKTDQGNTENLGQLKSSSGLFSRQLQASLETVSSYQPVMIYVTTESDININYPGNQIVMTTGEFNTN